MRIVVLSDLHGKLPILDECPSCDLFLIGGDIAPDLLGEYQLDWLNNIFRSWLERVPAKEIVAIAGNHDFCFQKNADEVDKLNLPWTYLRNSGTQVDGLNIYGIPYVPFLVNWAFYAPDRELEAMYKAIPEDTDIILSHGPPYGYGDVTVPRFGGINAGAQQALDAIDRVKPQLFVCGHIHEGRGQYQRDDTAILNVSAVDENYIPHASPFVEIDL